MTFVYILTISSLTIALKLIVFTYDTMLKTEDKVESSELSLA